MMAMLIQASNIFLHLGAWIFTEGLNCGISKEVGSTFQEDLAHSELAAYEHHCNIPLVGFPPWREVTDKEDLNIWNVRID